MAPLQAFYIPWGEDLQRWSATHPEYTRPQLLSLLSLVADSQVSPPPLMTSCNGMLSCQPDVLPT